MPAGPLSATSKNKAVVVGLDGVPHSMLVELGKRGRIPHISAIFKTGFFGRMSVSIPEISSVSWSSFMTGAQPGVHGIYGFMDLEPGTYKMYFPNFNHLRAPAVWDQLAESGKKSVVINMPATYPARAVNGALISGFVAVDINKAVYPRSLVPKLLEFGYKIDIDTARGRQDHEFLIKDLHAALAARERAVEYLWDEIDWDLFMVVVTGTDRLLHFLWDAWESESHPYHHAFVEYFERVDDFVGRVYERFLEKNKTPGGQSHFFMLSDHGFTGIRAEVNINRWLKENGYLKFNKEEPQSIMDIGPGSLAFALDPSRIYINVKGRYPLGAVDAADCERLRREIRAGVESIGFEGSRVIKAVFSREEIYSGPYTGAAPDLVLLSEDGFDLKGRVNRRVIFDKTVLSGMHTQHDAFFFGSSDIPCGSIFEAKDIIMKVF